MVQEALDLYLSEHGAGDVDAVLALEGALSAEEADEVERRINAAWATWTNDT